MMLTRSLPLFQPTRPRFGNTPPVQDERLSQKNAQPLAGCSEHTLYMAMTEDPPAVAYYIRFSDANMSLAEKQGKLRKEETSMLEAQARLEASTGKKLNFQQTFHLYDENAGT